MASTIAFIPFGEDSFLFELTMHPGVDGPNRITAVGRAGLTDSAFIAVETASAFIAAR